MENHKLNDRKYRLLGIPLISLLIVVVVRPEALASIEIFMEKLSISFLSTLMLWEGNRMIFLYSRRWFPAYEDTAKRIVYQTLSSLVFTFITTLTVDQFYCKLILNNPPISSFEGFKISLFPTIVVTLIYESAYFFQEWKNNVKKTESLARENVQSQLEVLKNQLDPHF
ncbi:MAG: histidine kinase, partial [Runella slithyformis]